MEIKDYGNSLISSDLKRLKKLRSLEKDLETYFIAHKNTLLENGLLSCKVADGKTPDGLIYWVCKERVIVTNPKTGASDGCRLWFLIIFESPIKAHYVKTLLYSAKEEKKYPKDKCYQIIKKALESIL